MKLAIATGLIICGLLPGSSSLPAPAEESASSCQTDHVGVSFTQKYSEFYGGYLYDISASNGTGASVHVYASVYDDDGKRKNIWDSKLKSAEEKILGKEYHITGPNKGHVGNVKFVACPVDKDRLPACSRFCENPA